MCARPIEPQRLVAETDAAEHQDGQNKHQSPHNHDYSSDAVLGDRAVAVQMHNGRKPLAPLGRRAGGVAAAS